MSEKDGEGEKDMAIGKRKGKSWSAMDKIQTNVREKVIITFLLFQTGLCYI